MIDIQNIKFRVYDEQTKKMWYTHPKEYTKYSPSIKFEGIGTIPFDSIKRKQLDVSVEFKNNTIHIDFGSSYSHNSKYKRHVMINIGLKSGRNKDEDNIYAGDILVKHIKKSGDKVLTNPFVVQWQDDICGFNVHDKSNHWYEIIGNIHQTKNYKKLLSKPFVKQKL